MPARLARNVVLVVERDVEATRLDVEYLLWQRPPTGEHGGPLLAERDARNTGSVLEANHFFIVVLRFLFFSCVCILIFPTGRFIRFTSVPVGVPKFSRSCQCGREQRTAGRSGPLHRTVAAVTRVRPGHRTRPIRGRCFPSVFPHQSNVRRLSRFCGRPVRTHLSPPRTARPLPGLPVDEPPRDRRHSNLHGHEESLWAGPGPEQQAGGD